MNPRITPTEASSPVLLELHGSHCKFGVLGKNIKLPARPRRRSVRHPFNHRDLFDNSDLFSLCATVDLILWPHISTDYR
jgi:hypothetical protein